MGDEEAEFEREVRQLARELWPSADGGAVTIDGKERDGVYITDDNIFLIEATVSKAANKADLDNKKLLPLIEKFRRSNPEKSVKGFFVTKFEPTADQRAYFLKTGSAITAISFNQFRARLVDGKKYIDLRKEHSFGSARDPFTNSYTKIDDVVPNTILEEGSVTSLRLKELSRRILGGERFVVSGDYGVGKSTTLSELFLEAKKDYLADRNTIFPIHINLKEHHGQPDGAEVLYRHAKKIGYPSPEHLVKAWKAGFVVLFIDGFDEIASIGWSSKKLKDLRFSSLAAVRDLVHGLPKNRGAILAGRKHFFDSDDEMFQSLGLDGDFKPLEIHEFDEEQMDQYLKKKNYSSKIPAWMPRRPYLLGELLSKGIIQSGELLGADLSPAQGWDYLLNRVSERESKIELGMSGDSVRKILERLASIARSKVNGNGPLNQGDMRSAFLDVVASDPDDQGMQLLMRLPGLGSYLEEDGSRQFIDDDLVDAARAGDVCRFILEPHSGLHPKTSSWIAFMGDLGSDVARIHLPKGDSVSGILTNAMKVATEKDATRAFAGDVLAIMQRYDNAVLKQQIVLSDALISKLTLAEDGPDLRELIFRDCLIQLVEIDGYCSPEKMPKIVGGVIGKLEGVLKRSDLPSEKFQGMEIEEIGSEFATNSSIVASDLPMGVKVLLGVLRKLFFQKGGGRQESAFFRGLEPRYRGLVPEVLELVRSEGLTLPGRENVWTPIRNSMPRVGRIVGAPVLSNDPLVLAARKLRS